MCKATILMVGTTQALTTLIEKKLCKATILMVGTTVNRIFR